MMSCQPPETLDPLEAVDDAVWQIEEDTHTHIPLI